MNRLPVDALRQERLGHTVTDRANLPAHPPTAPFSQHLRGRKVLITGGLGFIGSSLAHRLVDLGAHVVLVDGLIAGHGGNLFNIRDIQDRLTLNLADVRNDSVMSLLVKDQEYVFNLAGHRSHTDSMTNPYNDLDLNCRAPLSLLECCRHHNPRVKIVHASTRQVYGRPEYLPVDERHPTRPLDVNGVDKLAGELYHLVYHSAYGIRTCILRLTNTYGPRMRVQDSRQTFLGGWIRQLIEGETLQIYGDGRQLRDFNYVDDVVDAFLLAAASDASDGQVYNLGGGPPISLGELAELLIDLNGGGRAQLVPFPRHQKMIDIGSYYANAAKIHAVLGSRPRIPLREGLARTLAYYREYHDHYWTPNARSAISRSRP